MNRGLSLYLDLVRLIAALEVFLYHLPRMTFTGVERAWWNAYGHEAVVVFFVLSGYLISYAAYEREDGLRSYTVNRVCRIYSVALPALVLTLAWDTLGRTLSPELYTEFPPLDRIAERLIVSVLLLNHSWWLDVQVFSNTPYWSIAYEFWYYFIFGAFVYLRGRARWAGIALFCIVAGPVVLLMFPLWLLGVFAQRQRLSARLPGIMHLLLALSIVPVAIAYDQFDLIQRMSEPFIELLGRDEWKQWLLWSRYVSSDLVLGVALAMHFVGMRHLGERSTFGLDRVARPLRQVAASTFTLYLLHQPLVLFIGALWHRCLDAPIPSLVLLFAVLATVFFISELTENRRRHLLAPIGRIVDALMRIVRALKRIRTSTRDT